MLKLMQGDCLELMKDIPDGSVDLVLTDPPYGTTQIKWDKPLDWDSVWREIKRITKPNAATILFSSQPFTTDLIQSNRRMFRYDIIWEKTQSSGFLNARKMPLKSHETICVFYQKLPIYNPQMSKVEISGKPRTRQNIDGKREHYRDFTNINNRYTDTGARYPKSIIQEGAISENGLGRVRKKKPFFSHQYGRVYKEPDYIETGLRYPVSYIRFSSWNGALFGKTNKAVKHPTQKPVDLLEYLIKTYSNEGETVLDFTMGSGSAGVACININRNFIGIELDADYFKIAEKRIADAQNK